MQEPNFIEAATVEAANEIDLNRYTFLERVSADRGIYVFKKRAKFAK